MASAPATATPARLGPPAGARLAVTGGCGGIGRALVAAALADGLEVAVLDLPASIERHPPPRAAFAVALDATDEQAITAAFAEVARRWTSVETDGARVPIESLIERMEAITSKMERTSDPIAKAQYERAHAALAEQLRYAREIGTARERVVTVAAFVWRARAR